MSIMSGLVYDARDRLVEGGVVLLDTDDKQGEVCLNCFNINDIASIQFKRREGVIEVSQHVAETPNFCLAGYTKERAEKFRSREELLSSVSLGDEETLLIHHPETHDFKYKVVVKPYNREVAE